MPNIKNKIQKDQKKFFNEHSEIETPLVYPSPLIDKYVNREQYEGFAWIKDAHTILDYGCGTGTSIDRFLLKRNPKKYKFIGVDIADKAISKAKNKYPDFEFHQIEQNRLNKIENNSIDAAYIMHVLHHSTSHQEYFDEIYSKLKPNGKLLINDLSSRNPIIRLGRKVFGFMPQFIKKGFSNDLVVNDTIPDKYPVDIDNTIAQLTKSGFKIVEVGYRHLFFFLFVWLDNFVRLSKNKYVSGFYKELIKFEDYLSGFPFFQRYTELFYIYAIKPNRNININIPESGDYSSSLNSYVYNLVPEGSTCLDVGCWNGNLGAKLISEKHCKVDGIDVNQQMLAEAKKRGFSDTYNINLNNSDYTLVGIQKTYDVIIFADLLEHLINPEKALSDFRYKLNKDGIIIVSLPNVAFALNRINLLLGKWNYREFGTLDKTHLKFFTMSTAQKMIKNAGYKVTEVKPYNQFGILEKLNFLLHVWPELFAYQIIIVANKNGR